MSMNNYQTQFGALNDFTKGRVELIDDNPKNYVFSNIFEVCSTSAAYERVAVAKNFEYVIEAARAEGTSEWFSAGHDELALCMDGEIESHLVMPNKPLELKGQGAHRVEQPSGKKMGRVVLRRGHMGLLPKGAAYRFHAGAPSAMMIQTIEGPETVQKWSRICQAV
jgi:hypothetical protein